MNEKPLQAYMEREQAKQTSTWALVLMNGIAALGIGLIFLASPGTTLQLVMKFIGLVFLVGGFMSFFSIALSSEHWIWKFIAGLAGVIGGMIVMGHPAVSVLLVDTVLVLILGGAGVVMGGSHLIQAFRGGGWGIGFLGLLFIGFGLILVFSPIIGAIVLPFALAILGIIGGIIAIFIAFRMRRVEIEGMKAAE